MTRLSRYLSLSLLIVLIICLSVPASAKRSIITLDSLLHEMIDMQRLTTVPESGLTCKQQSSYDRASTTETAPNWFANYDRDQFIREEKHGDRTEYVMSEMTGPGTILRIWSADPENGGTLRIYIDGAEKPVLEANTTALTSGGLPEFPPPYSVRLAAGANLYFPIPYQRSCKVTCDHRGMYYHVGYRTYPSGTIIQSFTMNILPSVKKTIDMVGAVLAKPSLPFTIKDSQHTAKEVTIQPGEETVLYDLNGPSAVTRFEVKMDVPKEELTAAMREALLTVRFDKEREPSIWAPLGDFFGSTPGINQHESLASGMLADGTCYANWNMPFGERARFVIRNDSTHPITFATKLWTKPYVWDRKTSMYFHAKWQNQWFPANPEFLDWPILIAHGKGRFVGVSLGVVNTVEWWWGEGDEKIWIDDDTFPSYFGTGTEDYFGYAWCSPELYTHAYHNQSIVTGPANFGYSAEARYHLFDDIPFQRHFRFYLEKWAAAERGYSSTAYWYATAGSSDLFEPVPIEKRRLWKLPELPHVAGALEAEKLEVVKYTAGTTSIQILDSRFSYGKQLFWQNDRIGGILELKFPVESTGQYKVTLGLTQAVDYGIHEIRINNKSIAKIDLYCLPQNSYRPTTADLGIITLPTGDNSISLECLGSDLKSVGNRYMAGIDYILLEPVK